MKVKEVVVMAAGLLGMKKDMENWLQSATTAAKEKVAAFVDSFNLVENELALNYVPLRTQETVLVENGRVKFQYFTREPARVILVTDEEDNRLEYTVFPTDIRLRSEAKVAKVSYAFLPKAKSIDEESDYQSRVSVGLMACGVAAEYCAMQGQYTEAAYWNKKFKEGIPRTHEPQRGGKIPSRSWV